MNSDSRFELVPDESAPGWMVCTNRENGVAVRFERGRFNDTQDFSFGGPQNESRLVDSLGVLGIARIMREMGDWLAANHPDEVGG